MQAHELRIYSVEESPVLIHFYDAELRTAVTSALTQLGATQKRTPPPPSILEDEASRWLEAIDNLAAWNFDAHSQPVEVG